MAEDDPNRDNNERRAQRARELAERAGEPQLDAEEEARSAAGRIANRSKTFRRLASVFASLRRWLGPLGSLLAWLIAAGMRWFRWVVLQKNRQGEGSFSFLQLILRGLLSVLALMSVHIFLSAVYFYATSFEETVYVTGKQEIVTGELYQFGGCTSLPCSTESDNGKFYLIESSLYFPVMLYPEENVFANVPQQDAACHVHGYGLYFRTLRWLYKSAQLYQHVVDVSCRPYTDAEVTRAVEGGAIGAEQ